ncbi:MAG: TPM domain-containing protein [Terriglobales bacterium]
MKRTAKTMLLTGFLLVFASFLYAEPVAQLKPTDYVNDFAHVIDQNTVTQLDDLCKQIDEKAHAQIAVVTINSLDGEDVEKFAVDLFQKWGVGSKSSDKGVLILVAVKDHKYWTEVGYGLEPILCRMAKLEALAAKPCHR